MYALQGQTGLSLGFSAFLRFWFGGNLERKLGEAFSPPQFTVRESEVSERRFFCVCVRVCVRKHWQMVSRPHPFYYYFFGFGRSFLDRNGSGMVVQSYFLLIFSLNPFIKFYLSWSENGSATLSLLLG